LLDRNRPDDAHTDARLTTEPVIWLGTTCPDARPHHIPVWFSTPVLVTVSRIVAWTRRDGQLHYRTVP
jgi:hypothetical protein